MTYMIVLNVFTVTRCRHSHEDAFLHYLNANVYVSSGIMTFTQNC